ncbi:hypothetical protein HPB50_012315 [Hyalomma asiaticum]|uniref:Uncharacterized protein n=1 Tax=Hyalomma asiaticum TaxID=266040 RepID=A0ACB7TIT9_HYAAI|nr:hypothetical protein HPB50_012315 [Hyalomma asiaticum]
MSAADSAQRSDVPQQATNVLKPATLVVNAAGNGSAPSANMDDAGESEAKKLRVDEDKTSTYDLSEDEDIDCDETPFTLVSYKKKRPEGIPVVFRPSDEGSNFWQVNPNRAASEIVSAAKDKVQSFRVNRDGSFSVNVVISKTSSVDERSGWLGSQDIYSCILYKERRQDTPCASSVQRRTAG